MEICLTLSPNKPTHTTMSTVILKWNPAFSSYSMLHYLADIRDLNLYNDSDFDWSVWEHERIHRGDRYYWLKVGAYGQIGIVGAGTITSEPYSAEDWSGKGRPTFYVSYTADLLLNPDALPILTAKELQAAIPDFEWTGGHSGLVLNDTQAAALDTLWQDFVKRNSEEFERAKSLPRGDRDLIYIKPKESCTRITAKNNSKQWRQ